MVYAVIESTPGYLPDSDALVLVDTYEEGVEEAERLVGELIEQGYDPSRTARYFDDPRYRQHYAVYCYRSDTIAADLGRVIVVEPMEEDPR